ncbi:hypothetical protein [Mycobacterium sp. NPDC050441]|uniref:hypothetical protein n=1 Tax=Mycobacterium sp. NPDC050441 TaxID=3155403 RepID=UPI0033EA18C7
MNPELLPEDLRDDRRLSDEDAEYPIRQVNPVTGYRTVLYRSGTDADFLGWIELLNEDRTRTRRVPDASGVGGQV